MVSSSFTPRLEPRSLVVSAAGAVGALAIHALLVLLFVVNLSLPSPQRPNLTGAGVTARVSSAEPDMSVVFIDDPTPAENSLSPKVRTLASRGMTAPDLQVVVSSPDPSSAAANAKAEQSDDAHDDPWTAEEAEHARLYGRYLGQLQARIERAWTRPRTEIGAPQFSCQVRIQQNRRGDVIDAGLVHCNGTERWQQSLVSAIRTAAPLPAPPDASVYADVLWLSFSSEALKGGASTQGFEPEAGMASAAARSALESFHQFASGIHGDLKSDDKDASRVLHLTIIGSPQGPSPPSTFAAEPPTTPTSLEPRLPDRLPQ